MPPDNNYYNSLLEKYISCHKLISQLSDDLIDELIIEISTYFQDHAVDDNVYES